MARKITCRCCGTIRVVSKTSNYTGVDYHKKNKKYRARVTDEIGQTHHLGYFVSEEEASYVYDDYIINNAIVNRPLNHPSRICT